MPEMTKEELLDAIHGMSVGYSGAAERMIQNPSFWVTEEPRSTCEAEAMAACYREFSDALLALAEEVNREYEEDEDDVDCPEA